MISSLISFNFSFDFYHFFHNYIFMKIIKLIIEFLCSIEHIVILFFFCNLVQFYKMQIINIWEWGWRIVLFVKMRSKRVINNFQLINCCWWSRMIKISINPSFTLIKFKISRVTVTHNISRGSRVTIMEQKFMLQFFKYYCTWLHRCWWQMLVTRLWSLHDMIWYHMIPI